MVMFVALLAVLVEADVGFGAAPSGNMGPHASGMHFVPCAAGAHRFVPPGSPHDVLLSCGTVDCATPDQLWLHRDPAATSKWRLPAAGASGPVVDAASGRCISVGWVWLCWTSVAPGRAPARTNSGPSPHQPNPATCTWSYSIYFADCF